MHIQAQGLVVNVNCETSTSNKNTGIKDKNMNNNKLLLVHLKTSFTGKILFVYILTPIKIRVSNL